MAPTKEENEAGYFRPKVDEAAMCLFDRFLALTNMEMEAIVEPHFNWSLTSIAPRQFSWLLLGWPTMASISGLVSARELSNRH